MSSAESLSEAVDQLAGTFTGQLLRPADPTYEEARKVHNGLIDLSPMTGMHVDPKARTARAQGGLTWNLFNRETQLHGLATTGGVISTTGIGGLTLGGGIGWLMGKHALALDNLLSIELVLADGRVVTASAENNRDLFWALRGGGGNFGAYAHVPL
jgi:FAD/FMN-containing dehydrogenase